jgi:hypothetical protein
MEQQTTEVDRTQSITERIFAVLFWFSVGISYFERERDNGGPLLPLSAVREVSVNCRIIFKL